MTELQDKIRQELDENWALSRKYRDQPRTGWLVKGSRAKSNQAITVGRVEAVSLAERCHGLVIQNAAYLYETLNLRHYLEQLAKGEHDEVTCKKCFGTYQSGWLAGKCPYCEAEAGALSMLDEIREG